jgi:hypothetical protein
MAKNALTKEEQNLIKDILKVIADDENMSNKFRQRIFSNTQRAYGRNEFDSACGVIWNKLQNGRLTVIQ